MAIFINYDQNLEPIEIRNGSVQEIIEKDVRIGKRNMKYFKAKGI